MHTTFTIDDSLLAHAGTLSGLRDSCSRFHEDRQALILREASLRLASLPVRYRGSHYGVRHPDFYLETQPLTGTALDGPLFLSISQTFRFKADEGDAGIPAGREERAYDRD